MRSPAQPAAALALTLALSACSTTPAIVTPAQMMPCPKPPAHLMQRMEPLPAIPMSLSGPLMPDRNTSAVAPGSTP